MAIDHSHFFLVFIVRPTKYSSQFHCIVLNQIEATRKLISIFVANKSLQYIFIKPKKMKWNYLRQNINNKNSDSQLNFFLSSVHHVLFANSKNKYSFEPSENLSVCIFDEHMSNNSHIYTFQ